MRETVSSSSVKAVSLNKEKVMEAVRKASDSALKAFPEIEEIRLFGSFAKDEVWGLSDVDILVVVRGMGKEDPIDRIRPYARFFAQAIDLAVDILVADSERRDEYTDLFSRSVLIVGRP